MKRIEKLRDQSLNDFMISRDWAKLSPTSKEFVERFINENEGLNYSEFASLVTRLGLSSSPYSSKVQLLDKKQFKNISAVLGILHKTIPGFYGYVEEKRWVHPLDR